MDAYEMKPGARIELKNPPVGHSTAGRALGAIACCALTLACLAVAAEKMKGIFSRPKGPLG